jgi:hypothetical protein
MKIFAYQGETPAKHLNDFLTVKLLRQVICCAGITFFYCNRTVSTSASFKVVFTHVRMRIIFTELCSLVMTV